MKEYGRHVCLGQQEKLTIAERIMGMWHNMEFNSIRWLDKATGYVDYMVKEVTEIWQGLLGVASF
jgi:hypothetical protein